MKTVAVMTPISGQCGWPGCARRSSNPVGLGFVATVARRPLGPNPRSFGHFGTGGAVGFADPDAGVGFGHVMDHVIPR